MNSLLFIGMFLVVVVNLQEILLPQSDIYLGELGSYFISDQGADWLDQLQTDSVRDCAYLCNERPSCRTFNYNFYTNECDLFQVEPSPDQISFDSSRLSYFGYVQLHPALFSAFNQSCDACVNDRYLICDGSSCQCTFQSFWNGEICEKQRYAGITCNGIDQCRNYPFNLTCNVVPICSVTGFSPSVCSMNRTVLLYQHNATAFEPYTLRSVNFVAISNSLTLTFSWRDSTSEWLLDNITLVNVNESVDVLSNGDFETGNLTNWNYCNPNSSPFASRLETNGTFSPQSGQQYYFGGPRSSPDYLSQTIRSEESHLYRLSFWLGHVGASVSSSFRVTISY